LYPDVEEADYDRINYVKARAAFDVQSYGGLSNVHPTTVIVITWEGLEPWSKYPPYDHVEVGHTSPNPEVLMHFFSRGTPSNWF
jgi:hypothetical protein